MSDNIDNTDINTAPQSAVPPPEPAVPPAPPPEPAVPPAPPAPDTRPKRVRRVGTFTMGISMIIMGVAICAAMFTPNIDLILLARLSPLVLVALGVEIVIYACFAKQDKIKYDGFSIFIAIILIGFSMCAAFVPVLFEYIGPNAEKARYNISAQINDKMYAKRAELPQISDMRVSINNNHMRRYSGDEDISSIMPGDEVYAYVVLGEAYTDKEVFAKDATRVYKALSEVVPCNVRMGIMSAKVGSEPYFEFEIHGKFVSGLTPEQMAQKVSVMKHDAQNNIYLDENELARIQKERAGNDAQTETSERIVQMENDANSRIQKMESDANLRIQQMENDANSSAETILNNANSEATRIINEANSSN